MRIYPGKAFLEAEWPQPLFIVEHLIPSQSIILLYAKFGTWKTSIAVHIAQCVQTGDEFFGLKTRQGNVLFLELDMAEPLLQKRLLTANFPVDFTLAFENPFDVVACWKEFPPAREKGILHDLKLIAEELKPVLVVVDTLRKSHTAQDIASDVPSRVYNSFRQIFPYSSLLFLHHERKAYDTTAGSPDDERFSGSQAWVNDANVAIRVWKRSRLVHLAITKSHAGASWDYSGQEWIFKPAGDGFTLLQASDDTIEKVRMLLEEEELKKLSTRDFDKIAALRLGVSDRRVREVRGKL